LHFSPPILFHHLVHRFFSTFFPFDLFSPGPHSNANKPYLANGLDKQASLSFEEMEWSSSLSKSQVWNIEETGNDSALITLRVEHMLKKTTQSDPEKDPAEENAGPYEKYFVVPVKTDGKSFVVHKVPYFIAAEEKPEITSESSINEKGKLPDTKLQEEISSALNTFFKVYTSGTQDSPQNT